MRLQKQPHTLTLSVLGMARAQHRSSMSGTTSVPMEARSGSRSTFWPHAGCRGVDMTSVSDSAKKQCGGIPGGCGRGGAAPDPHKMAASPTFEVKSPMLNKLRASVLGGNKKTSLGEPAATYNFTTQPVELPGRARPSPVLTLAIAPAVRWLDLRPRCIIRCNRCRRCARRNPGGSCCGRCDPRNCSIGVFAGRSMPAHPTKRLPEQRDDEAHTMGMAPPPTSL